jgi:hypothetical protein
MIGLRNWYADGAMIRKLARYLAGVIALLAAGGAHASISVNVSVDTSYGYGFLGTPFVTSGDNLSYRNGTSVAGFPAEFGLDFKTKGSGENFSFLHNQYCVGKCTVFSMTTVTVSLQNLGDTAESMRFDSQITAGHLARQGINPDSTASFDFTVSQFTSGVTHELYSANGIADSTKTEITTSDGVDFNGLTRSSNGDAWNVLDWSATNLNLMLDAIPAGETSILTYSSTTRVATSASSCLDLTSCPGVQVAFGDPRNDGGSADLVAKGTRPLFAGSPLAPVIGRLYSAAEVTTDIVAPDAPLPPTPRTLRPVTYGAPFVSQIAAVPEPASWMMMIAGFGIVGMGLRRRTSSLAMSAV